MQLLATIIEAQQSQGRSHELKHVRAVGFEESYTGPDVLTYLSNLADGSYEGLSADGVAGEDPMPVLEGKITVDSHYYPEDVNALRDKFNRLELVITGPPCIKFADLEVKRVLVSAFDVNNNGEIDVEEAKISNVGQLFAGNANIETFEEFKYFTSSNNNKNGAFINCSKLRRISLPPSWTSISYKEYESTVLEHIDIPEGVWSIGAQAFYYLSTLKEINLPQSVTFIGSGAFNGSSITRFVWPYNIPDTGGVASLPLLTYAEIGPGTTTFSSLGDCPLISTLVVRATTPPTTSYWSLRNSAIPTIYVPDASVNAYKSATGWTAWASKIKPISEKP